MAARIRHIALSVKDIDATADFYEKAFGLKRSPKSEGRTAWRVYMSDGEVNLALLQYKSEVGSGLKDPSAFIGIHHFGFQSDDFEAQQKQIEDAGGEFFFDLGDPDDDDFERKFKDPNGIIFDLNWKGWSLTKGKLKAKAKTLSNKTLSNKALGNKAPGNKASGNKTAGTKTAGMAKTKPSAGRKLAKSKPAKGKPSMPKPGVKARVAAARTKASRKTTRRERKPFARGAKSK
jgi:catechol 2,3-dioxygenase-like lactoylglutathione lyase family enzyme